MPAYYSSSRSVKKRKQQQTTRKRLLSMATACLGALMVWTGLDVLQLLMRPVLPPFISFEPTVPTMQTAALTPPETDSQPINVADLITISENILTVFTGSTPDTHLVTTDHNVFDISQLEPQDTDWADRTPEPFALQFNHDTLDELRNVDILINRFFTVNNNTGISAVQDYFDIDYFLSSDLHIEPHASQPQVLIFHTHGMSEFFVDSPGRYHPDYKYHGIMGVGVTLAHLLEEVYGIGVIHHKGLYDWVDGQVQRSGSYERSGPSVERILAENPSIQLVIDLHRDGIDNGLRETFVTYINGRPYARLMFVNGLSSLHLGGVTNRLYHIPNPYIQTNLALSFNLQMAMNERFPGLSRRTFLAAFRFINHLRPLSLLVEVGMQANTMADAHNAMEPLAYLIYSVVFTQ